MDESSIIALDAKPGKVDVWIDELLDLMAQEQYNRDRRREFDDVDAVWVDVPEKLRRPYRTLSRMRLRWLSEFFETKIKANNDG